MPAPARLLPSAGRRTAALLLSAAGTLGLVTGCGAVDTGGGGAAGARPTAQDGGRTATAQAAPVKQPPAAAEPVEPPSYEEKMAAVYPLDPELELSGEFRTLGGDEEGRGSGPVKTYRVDVEEGLPLDGDLFLEAVERTLNDDRGWGHGGAMRFRRVGSGPADIVLTLASPGTTADWCARSGLDTTQSNVSCDSSFTERTMINAWRWAQGSETYGPGRIHAYRQMVINHETGHRLGYGHAVCPRDGAPAPVMMQQTKFLTLDGLTCKPNPWPHP